MRVRIPICIHDAEIVLCMLIQVFGRYPVATCRRLAGKCDIAFENLVGVAADLYVWTLWGMLGRLWCGPFRSFRPRECLFGPGLMTPVLLRQLLEPDGLRHVIY